MSDAPITDWDLIYRWEWFRRNDWREDFRRNVLGEGGGECRAFVDMAKLSGAEITLDASCGTGQKTICMAEMGVNILGCDASLTAITTAAELAAMENAPINYFRSNWQSLPGAIPHHFDAIFNDSLNRVSNWDELGASLVGIYHSLKPGGFLMFTGIGEDDEDEAGVSQQWDEWNERPHEFVAWHHRDGAVNCSKVVQKTKGDDFIDERYLYVICDNGVPRLESTEVRRPAYWTWQHWKELTTVAGFCHLETRVYERYGKDGEPLKVNVAWKSKNGVVRIDHQARNAPYQD